MSTILLHALGYIAAVAAFLFVTLSLASGLLWLSEVIEEHARAAKTFGQRGIYVVVIIHVLLWLVDSLPFPQIAFSIACHFVYLQNFTLHWPLISLTSKTFIGSCVLVLTDHFVWFFYFSKKTRAAKFKGSGRRHYGDWRPPIEQETYMSFMEIATFFAVCVWLAPLFLFLSLSAMDNALPTSNGDPGTPMPGGSFNITPPTPITGASPTSLFQILINPIKSLLPTLRRTRRDRDADGLIAPRPKTPRSASYNSTFASASNGYHYSSPLPSPNPVSGVTEMTDTNRFANESMLHSGLGKGFLQQPPPPRRATSDGVGPPTSFSASTSTLSPHLGTSGSGSIGRSSGGGRRRVTGSALFTSPSRSRSGGSDVGISEENGVTGLGVITSSPVGSRSASPLSSTR